jgi:hypothetical protein
MRVLQSGRRASCRARRRGDIRILRAFLNATVARRAPTDGVRKANGVRANPLRDATKAPSKRISRDGVLRWASQNRKLVAQQHELSVAHTAGSGVSRNEADDDRPQGAVSQFNHLKESIQCP